MQQAPQLVAVRDGRQTVAREHAIEVPFIVIAVRSFSRAAVQ